MAGGLIIAAAAWHVATREVLQLAAAGIAVSTADDCFVDLVYLGLRLRRRAHPPTVLADRPAGASWMAIIVPAWDEAAVIGLMLRSMTGRLDHPRYRIFVGTYPNDPATLAAVVAVGDARIVPVTCSNPGPTTKADCLNHLWRAVVAYEADAAIRFKAVVFHDAEDVVDRDELRVFDRLIPGLAMVQLPVGSAGIISTSSPNRTARTSSFAARWGRRCRAPESRARSTATSSARSRAPTPARSTPPA